MLDPAEIFGPEGILAHHLPGYEPRPGQQQMAEAVAALLAGPGGGESLVVEAETVEGVVEARLNLHPHLFLQRMTAILLNWLLMWRSLLVQTFLSIQNSQKYGESETKEPVPGQ